MAAGMVERPVAMPELPPGFEPHQLQPRMPPAAASRTGSPRHRACTWPCGRAAVTTSGRARGALPDGIAADVRTKRPRHLGLTLTVIALGCHNHPCLAAAQGSRRRQCLRNQCSRRLAQRSGCNPCCARRRAISLSGSPCQLRPALQPSAHLRRQRHGRLRIGSRSLMLQARCWQRTRSIRTLAALPSRQQPNGSAGANVRGAAGLAAPAQAAGAAAVDPAAGRGITDEAASASARPRDVTVAHVAATAPPSPPNRRGPRPRLLRRHSHRLHRGASDEYQRDHLWTRRRGGFLFLHETAEGATGSRTPRSPTVNPSWLCCVASSCPRDCQLIRTSGGANKSNSPHLRLTDITRQDGHG